MKFIKYIAKPCLFILPIFFFYLSEASAEVNSLSNPADAGISQYEVTPVQDSSIKVEAGPEASDILLSSETSEIAKGTVGKRIAIFPFDNLTMVDNALNAVMPVIEKEMKDRGYSIVGEQELYSNICKDRVRETGTISKALAKKISDNFKVEGILLGSIVSYSIEGKPLLGLIARLIDPSDGSILWADYFSATGDDFITVLGLGEIKEMDELIQKVVNSLFASFTSEAPHKDAAFRVAVMPFMNDTDYKDAGNIASQMFVVHLFKDSGFMPLEYGEIKKNLVDMRIRVKGNLDYTTITELSKVIDVDGYLLGEVGLYFNGVLQNSPPAASVSARLIGSGNKKILWYGRGQMSGDDDVIIYDWRRLRSVDKVTDKIVTKLVDNLEKKKWN
ncbi:MAG: hypothetical protein HY807_06220 [Nitrospirae bacterium]|nr:hypothetical protein [Nitrospirota bacterium]